jgi:hypothetical protein
MQGLRAQKSEMRSASFAVEMLCKAIFCDTRRGRIAGFEQARTVGQRLRVRLRQLDFEGIDEPVPGHDGLVDVTTGVRRPALRLSETIATDSSRKIWFMVDEAITRMLPRVYLVHHHGLR